MRKLLRIPQLAGMILLVVVILAAAFGIEGIRSCTARH